MIIDNNIWEIVFQIIIAKPIYKTRGVAIKQKWWNQLSVLSSTRIGRRLNPKGKVIEKLSNCKNFPLKVKTKYQKLW